MGILSGKDLYSSKYITAEITDSGKHRHVIPIKYTIGDYFLAEIGKQVYCFKIEGERVETYSETAVRSFRVLSYTTKNYKPIAKGEVVLLGQVLAQNSLPKVTYNLYRSMKLLSNMEKNKEKEYNGEIKEFEPHNLPMLAQVIATKQKEDQDEYTEIMKGVVTFLEHLNVKQIVCPVREVSEFLEGELIATDPKFLGDVISTIERVDGEHKLVCNKPSTGKIPWLRTALILSLIGILGGVGYWLYSSGEFSNFSLGGFLGQSASSQQIMQEYPTPESLKIAVAQGKVKMSDLPPDIQREVNAVKLPAAPPITK